ncbi:MAG: GtrA family protein [Clostridium sp.]|nr:GtrA family protein [Clostridium sp.]
MNNSIVDKFTKTFFTKQFIIFVIIGVINTFSTTVFSTIYKNFIDPNIAFDLGYASGILVSYTLNSLITFKEKLGVVRLVKFAISNIPNFIIQKIVVLIVINILVWPSIIAYGLAAIIGVPVTFLIMKLFAFRKKN